jgi:uncharacterized protein YjbI with pentapeptide repeats
MSSAKNQTGIYNITSSNNNNNNQHITTESFIPGNFYKVVYRYYARGNFSRGYVESVFYNVTQESGVYQLINGLTHKEINNANKLALGGDEYVLLVNVNKEDEQDRGKLELVVLDEVRSVKKLKKNEFTGLNLSGLQLQGADLRGADLEDTTLIRAKLQEAHLEGVNLNGFDLYGAKLQGAHLQGVQLQKASLVNADLRNADLRGADLRGAKLQGAKLEGKKLEGTKLEGARIIDTNLNRASLTGPQRNGIIIIAKKNWNTSLNTTNNNNNNSNLGGGRFLQNKLKSGNSKTRSVKKKAFIASKKI